MSHENAEDFERKHPDPESRLREAELHLKEREFEARLAREKAEAKHRVSPLTTAVIAAIAALGGAAVTSVLGSISAANELELEKEKFRWGIVRDAIATGDPDQSAMNLKFLLNVGLLDDPDGSMQEYLAEIPVGYLPFPPPPPDGPPTLNDDSSSGDAIENPTSD